MAFNDHIQPMPFKQWIWKNRENKILLILSGVAIFIQFIWFKYLYPFPNFLPDSYSYIEAAFNNQTINMWPIGYSKFLRLFSSFTNSHTLLILFQYAFLQVSILYLLFTMAYQLMLDKWVLRILLGCNVLNPLLLHVSNFVSSDASFAALSLVWFTQLLWLLYRPDVRLLIIHPLVLLLVFSVRYNALYYPFISLAVIALIPIHKQTKMAGMAVIILLIGAFVGQTLHKYHTATGTTQFSAFGGWQLASNALFAYAHVQPDAPETVPAKFRLLHIIVNRHMDSLSNLLYRPDTELGIYYLWDEQSPLKKYMHYKYKKDSTINGFNQWASMAPLYSAYSTYLIQHHPIAFTKHYLWPNMVKYYVPSTEFLDIYNMGSDSIEPKATTWFGLKTNKVHSFSMDKQIKITKFFPVLLAVINLVFVLSFLGVLFLDGFKKSYPHFKRVMWWMLLVWICNFGFSVLASPIVLRYQVFPMIITFTFLVLLMTFIIQKSKSVKIKGAEYQNQHIDAEIQVQIS